MREYMKDQEFQSRYREALTETLQDATRQAQKALSASIATLTEIAADTGEQATARIQAARSTLEYALKLTEQLDIAQRLDALEGRVERSSLY